MSGRLESREVPVFGPGSPYRCPNCRAETIDMVLIRIDAEMTEKTGFDRDTVFAYFHREPPLSVCARCAELFKEWDLSRVRLALGALRP